VDKILIINPFGVGDVLFTTPVIRTIKDNQPDTIIGYWCNERVRDILKHNPHIDKIFALSRGDIKRIYNQSRIKGIYSFLKLVYSIKKEHFDISLDFSLDHRYGLISKLSGIKKRIGFNYKKRGRFLTDRIDIDGYQAKHVVEYYLDLLKFINIKPQDARLELAITGQSKREAQDFLAKRGINSQDLIIAIIPGAGASWGKVASIKQWPPENFAWLADKIVENYRAKIIIMGDFSEKELARQVMASMHHKAIDLSGITTLGELGALLSEMNLVITNDGGPLHMAIALGKKTVSFFGPVDPRVYGPYPADRNRHIVLRKALDCSPCYSKFRLNPCRKNKECLKAIDVEEALEAVNRLLK
jgi:lipopolysaccharide heptosyltransferase II